MPSIGISDNSPLMVQYIIQGLNNYFIGGVKVFQPKTLKDVIQQAILMEHNVALGYGGFGSASTSVTYLQDLGAQKTNEHAVTRSLISQRAINNNINRGNSFSQPKMVAMIPTSINSIMHSTTNTISTHSQHKFLTPSSLREATNGLVHLQLEKVQEEVHDVSLVDSLGILQPTNHNVLQSILDRDLELLSLQWVM